MPVASSPVATWWRDAGPGRMIAVAARAWWRHLPALLTILLVGQLARELFIRAAGFAATIDPLLGMLLLPFIVLARLATIVAMLLVVRSAMPSYRARVRHAASGGGASPARFRDVLAGSIVAFFVIYAAWGLIVDDATEYSSSYFEQVNFFDLPEGQTADPFALGLTWLTAGIVVVAFGLRLLLKHFAARLPAIAGFVAVYLEAVWVFIAVVVVRAAIDFVPAWLESRRVVVWATQLRDGLLDAVPPLRVALDVWNWVFAEGVEVIVLPLMWLALVGIVYANSLPTGGEPARPKGFRAVVRQRVRELGEDLVERWRPIAGSARTIWAAGAPTMGFIILLLAIVSTAEQWTEAATWRLVAPQELPFWVGADRGLSLVSIVIWEPVRICLLAAAFDTCLGLASSRSATRSREQAQPERVDLEHPQLHLD